MSPRIHRLLERILACIPGPDQVPIVNVIGLIDLRPELAQLLTETKLQEKPQ